MTIINANIEIKNSDFMGIDTCGTCPFLEIRLNDKPCKCKIFNKYPERFNPGEDYGLEIYMYRRLDECKNSELK